MIGRLKYYPRIQTRNSITSSLEELGGLKADWTSTGRLRRINPNELASRLTVIRSLREAGYIINEWKVARPENNPFSYAEIPLEVLASCVSKGVLDEGKIQSKLLDQSIHRGGYQLPFPAAASGAAKVIDRSGELRQVNKLLRVLKEERVILKQMAERPDISIEDIFRYFDSTKEKLGFLNVVIYRPREDGSWATALKSVIKGDKNLYEIDIDDPSSFEREGLAGDVTAILHDRELSKGSGKTIIMRLASKFGVEAVIFIHNRVKIDKAGIEPPPLLPDDHNFSDAVITELGMLVDEVITAIEKVKEKAGMIDTGKPFAPDRFLPPGNSRLVTYRRYGKLVENEIIDEPAKNGSHLLGSFYNFINRIAVAAWGNFPPDFTRERLLDVSKAVCMRVDGEEAAYTSARHKKVGNRVARWFEIGITKPKFQKLGLQTKAFYWLYKEAYLEELAKYIAGRGRFKWLNFILSIPSLIKAILYVKGIINQAPKKIAAIKVPIAFLAVQPTSIGPFYDYVEDIYPHRDRPNEKPDPEKLRIAQAVLPHGARLNPDNLVVEGDYGGIEHLIPDPAKGTAEGGVLNYTDERVNEMMWKRLRYEDRAGRDQLVVMDVTLADFRTFFTVQKKREVEAETVDNILMATKDL